MPDRRSTPRNDDGRKPVGSSASPSGAAATAWPLARKLLLVPAVVCLLQALGLVVNGVGALADPGEGLDSAVVEAVVFGLLALGLVLIAVGLLRGKAWSRGPLLAMQLIALLTAVAYASLTTLLGWILALTSAAAILVVVSRPVAEHLEGGRLPE